MPLTVTSRLKVKTLTSAYLKLTISVVVSSVNVTLLPLISYFVSSTYLAVSFNLCKSEGEMWLHQVQFHKLIELSGHVINSYSTENKEKSHSR